jgi:DNA-binding transcriptional MerR regulator/methylmalonyl-CoA mutase cobalamin-binding subunit
MDNKMNTLVDYSDEPKYTIKTVCTQTGIRAVTLRAWERRHGILTPYRSENRYRLYSDRDVAILRWIKNRIDNGMPISSAVTELRALMRSGKAPEAIPIGPATTPQRHTAPPAQYSRRLYQALVAHDEGRAGDVFHEIQSAFDLTTICQDVITPSLVELGEAWYRGSIRITTEHFASGYVRGKLLSMFQSYPSRPNAPYILVGCAPSEQHEIGALMVAVLLRSNGFRIEYLGPDIPLDDLVDYAAFEHPDLIVLSASLESSALELVRMQEKLAKVRPIPQFGYGGQAFVAKPDLKKLVQGNYLGDTLLSAVTIVRSLLPKERSAKNK